MTKNNYIIRIVYVKYIYEHGVLISKNHTSISNALAILNFHDACEQFLIIIADKLDFDPPREFMKYWDQAKEKGVNLPSKSALKYLNKVRVNFKHHGILPSYDSCQELKYKLKEFFIEASQNILGLDFLSISLSDIIEDEDVRKHLKISEQYQHENKYKESIDEAGIAFALFLKKRQDYFYIDKWAPFHQFEQISSHDPRYVPKKYPENKDLLYDFQMLQKNFVNIAELYNSLITRINIYLLGIDPYNYQKFSLLTPIIYFEGKQPSLFEQGKIYRNDYNLNEINSLFCYHFVVDNVLMLQRKAFDLINPFYPPAIRIKSASAKIYNVEEKNILIEVGEAKEGRIFKSPVSQHFPEPQGNHWQVIIDGIVRIIKYEDAEIYIKQE